jgi:hypothetical protein
LKLPEGTFKDQIYSFDKTLYSNGENIKYPTNSSTGQREKAPAEPVCLILLATSLSHSSPHFDASKFRMINQGIEKVRRGIPGT